uniref:Uncharacterized protein n=1 Tax=viral metagenome TaxID=1070528 RepID=A0A6M3K6R0_9ZZZZ
MSYLRGNSDEHEIKKTVNRASAFAQQVLGKVGGSLVYISPKKDEELVDLT